MKRLRRTITATTAILDKKFSLLPSEVLNLLNAIDELKGKEIAVEESADGDIQFVVGDNVYVATME